MEKLQNKALRIINFKPLRYSVNSLYNKCEILKFGDSIKLSIFLYARDNIIHSFFIHSEEIHFNIPIKK